MITFSRSLPFLVAEAQGFFAREGLAVELVITRSSTEQIRGLLAGTWEIGHTAADNVIAYVEEEGADLFMFLGGSSGLDRTLMVRPEIRTFTDLRGKTLGLDSLTTGWAMMLRRMLGLEGLRQDDYLLVAIGGGRERHRALAEGSIAGCLLGSPSDDELESQGFRRLASAAQYFAPQQGQVGAATRPWARDHADTMIRYIRAYVAATDWVLDPANRAGALELLRGEGLSSALAERSYARAVDPALGLTPRARLDPQRLREVIALRAQMGYLREPLPSPEKYYDLSYYQRAVASLPS